MNFILLSTKRILFLGALFFCYGSAVSQSLKYSDIKKVTNIDSLENNLQPQRSLMHLNQLLSLEQRRFLIHNENLGSNFENILLLAKQLGVEKSVTLILQLWKGQLIFLSERNHSEAKKNYRLANKNFTANADTVGMIISFQKLAELNLNHTTIELRNIKVGDKYAKRASELSKEYGDKELIINSLNLQFAAINHRPSKENLSKAEKLAAQMFDLIGNEPQLQRFRVSVLNSLVIYYTESGEGKKVCDTFKSILNASDPKEIPENYYGVMLNLSFICIDLKKYDEALEYLNIVLENTKEEKFKLLRVAAFSALNEMYLQQGNYKKALIFADSSLALQKNIHKSENLNRPEVTYQNNEVKNRNGALSFENKVIRNKDRGIIIDLTVTGFLLALLAVSLYKSRKEAYLQTAEIQRLSAVRDQYIYIVAHDLRSPILAMQGMYDLINESIKKQRYDDLERISYYIDETGIKTTDLLDNLFMWGMSQREELAYEPVQLNVREEVNKALSVYEAIKILNNFSFSNDCPETTTVFADQDSLQLILRNLIDNAVKHLPSSRGQIDIDVVESTTENVSRITVRDNGFGIDSSQLESIKYAFNNPAKAMIGEKGLGLGIVNIARFTEKNRGSITVESSLETGTKFEIYLPIKM
ncbi:MAG: signal transduction histidine kinase [Spirosomataceae bacterium]|jgi:signal transduction histidine kinase